MSQVKKKKSQNVSNSEEQSVPQALFPEIHNLDFLPVDERLPLLKLNNIKSTVQTSEQQIKIVVEVPSKIRKADVYLYVNDEKKDMYYNVSAGKFTFDHINLSKGQNLIHLFYRTGERKSSPVHTTIIRK